MTENEIIEKAIGCAIRVHKELGPGLLESSYQAALYFELIESGLSVEKEVYLPLVYRNVKLEHGYRVDLMIENKVILEIKSVECFNNTHMAQVLAYLKLSNCKFGIPLNFNVALMKNGIKRIAN